MYNNGLKPSYNVLIPCALHETHNKDNDNNCTFLKMSSSIINTMLWPDDGAMRRLYSWPRNKTWWRSLGECFSNLASGTMTAPSLRKFYFQTFGAICKHATGDVLAECELCNGKMWIIQRQMKPKKKGWKPTCLQSENGSMYFVCHSCICPSRANILSLCFDIYAYNW